MTSEDILKELRLDLKEIKKQITEIRILDVEQTSHLREHMKRTELNEEAVKDLKSFTKEVESKLSARIDSDRTFRRWFIGVATLIGPLSTFIVAFFFKHLIV